MNNNVNLFNFFYPKEHKGARVPRGYYTYEHGLNSNSIVRSSPLNKADRGTTPRHYIFTSSVSHDSQIGVAY